MSLQLEAGTMAGLVPHESGEYPLGANPELEHNLLTPERIYDHLSTSLANIISLQNPETGLTQAAADGRNSTQDHMDHFWLRDHAMLATALSNGARDLFPIGTPQRGAIDKFTHDSIDGLFELWGHDEWREGFLQEVIKEGRHTRLKDPSKAPPIHSMTSGEVDFWPTQNQPDAWGFAFVAIKRAVDNAVIEMTEEKREVLERAASYLARLEPEHARQVSMWEWTEPGLPPLSSVAVVKQGFESVREFIRDPNLKRNIARRINNADHFIQQRFPIDYTTEQGHESKTDLATLVALGQGALDRESFFRYMNGATQEIIPKSAPGMVRFKGDHYHRTDEGEPVWFMGLPYMASIHLKHAEQALRSGMRMTAEKFSTRGFAFLERAFQVVEKYGWSPELFERKNGEWVVPEDGTASHIGWNDAALIQASTQALRVQRLLTV